MDFSHPTHLPLEPGQHVSTSGEILAYAARRHGDAVGLICGDRQWTYGELDRLANRFANGVISELAGRDGPVGIMGRNAGEYAIAHFGTARSGRYSVNLSARFTADELVDAINRTRPAMLVVDAACRELADRAAARFEVAPLFLSYGDPVAEVAFQAFLDQASDSPPEVTVDPDAPGSVIFTGGTTGRPKAVVASQRARAISAMAAIEDFRLKPGEVGGFSVPLTHTAGLFSWFQPAVLAGMRGVIIPKWDPELFMDLVERHGIQVTFAVPTQIALLLDHPRFDSARLSSLKCLVSGGAHPPSALIARAERALPNLEIRRAYGSTETGHLAAQVRADRAVVPEGYNEPGGRLEIGIFKEPGVPAELGEVGELATRGAHLMMEYLDDPDQTTAYFRRGDSDGEWGWTGDLALRHASYFTLVGRAKHMILSGGYNIYPIELENVLLTHPEVADCAVVGVDDETWGELPVAAVAMRDGTLSPEILLDYVAERVARHKKLRRILCVDQIPRTPVGKIDVAAVRGLFRTDAGSVQPGT